MDLKLVPSDVPEDLAVALNSGNAEDAFLNLPETTRQSCI